MIIAVSSAHRMNSLEAVQYCIDTLKATVPIWKKVHLKFTFFLPTLIFFHGNSELSEIFK